MLLRLKIIAELREVDNHTLKQRCVVRSFPEEVVQEIIPCQTVILSQLLDIVELPSVDYRFHFPHISVILHCESFISDIVKQGDFLLRTSVWYSRPLTERHHVSTIRHLIEIVPPAFIAGSDGVYLYTLVDVSDKSRLHPGTLMRFGECL